MNDYIASRIEQINNSLMCELCENEYGELWCEHYDVYSDRYDDENPQQEAVEEMFTEDANIVEDVGLRVEGVSVEHDYYAFMITEPKEKKRHSWLMKELRK